MNQDIQTGEAMAFDPKQIYTHVPAQPGWFVAEPVGRNGRLHPVTGIRYTPVLAWLIDTLEQCAGEGEPVTTYTAVTPISANGEPDGVYALRQPDMTLTRPGWQDFTLELELLEYFKAAAERDAGIFAKVGG